MQDNICVAKKHIDGKRNLYLAMIGNEAKECFDTSHHLCVAKKHIDGKRNLYLSMIGKKKRYTALGHFSRPHVDALVRARGAGRGAPLFFAR